MSLLAHACLMDHPISFFKQEQRAARRQLDATIQAEIIEAKRIQQEMGCTWSEALYMAREDRQLAKMDEYFRPYDASTMNSYTNAMLIYVALLARMGARRLGISFIPPGDLNI